MAVPRHVAIVMDGNRRFSARLMQQPWKGHEWGKEKLFQVLEWCEEAGVSELTVYAFSIQNFHRPQKEFSYLMRLFVEACEELLARRAELERRGVRIVFIGRLSLLPAEVQEAARAVMYATRSHERFVLNVALAYGGREEITDAVRGIAAKVASGALDPAGIDEAVITEHLLLASEPDLVIRTGGERRTSNFLPWQAWYAEWCFLDTLWPELTKEEFLGCIRSFSERQRRFGR